MRRANVLAAAAAAIVHLAAGAAAGATPTQDPRDRRIEQLEATVAELVREVRELKQGRGEAPADRDQLADLVRQIAEEDGVAGAGAASWLERFRLGGYGEFHYNFSEDSGGDKFDIHRLVLYLGYEFNDWIQFHSETEIEHAFVTDGAGGELVLEQAYVDFLLSEAVNIRAGRILTPLGIINQRHEPPSFNGVERPTFAKVIIPTTWASDGAGIFGKLCPSVSYEAYVVGGLDGSEFSALDGIRGGRIKERPSFHDPAFTGRLDWYPFAEHPVAHGQTLRFGVSAYAGGLDNGNNAKDPGIDGDIQIYSADFEYTVGPFDFRGAAADIRIDGARAVGGGTAEEIFGWYLEAACHVWPDAWKTGRFEQADAVLFVRYDDLDTQHRMPSGIPADPRGRRDEWTVGTGFYLTPNFVIKADYQWRDSDAGGLGNLFNVGVGWSF